jgi:hypothetical protein
MTNNQNQDDLPDALPKATGRQEPIPKLYREEANYETT